MIGIIGYQEDAIGFALAGIKHVQEIPPNAGEKEIQQAIKELQEHELQLLLIPQPLSKYATNTDCMVIEIPTNTQSKEAQINQLTKELLGVEL